MRFVVSHRRAGKFDELSKRRSRESVAAAIEILAPVIDVVADVDPVDPLARRVVIIDADEESVAALKAGADSEDLIIEPEVLFYYEPPAGYHLFDGAGPVMSSANIGTGKQVSFKVFGAGKVLEHARVEVGFLSGSQRVVVEKRTSASGNVTFHYGPAFSPAVAVVEPYAGYWPMLVKSPAATQSVTCPALPVGPTGWWHDLVGASVFAGTPGAGIAIGVVDSGCGPHPALAHVKSAGAFVNGQILPNASIDDVERHGTHVCSLIGARALHPTEFEGMAPEATLVAARVYAGAGVAGSQADVAHAIESLSKTHQVDLINLSLGTPSGGQNFQLLRDAIKDAFERGSLCVAAAGNVGLGQVSYPAMFDSCVAVAALGLSDWAPTGSLASAREPISLPARYGQNGLFLSLTSNHGVGVDGAGPGLGIVAAVPNRFGKTNLWAAMDGTSMAAPIVLGALASALANDAAYGAMPRDGARAAWARTTLGRLQRMMGFTADYAGQGIPVM